MVLTWLPSGAGVTADMLASTSNPRVKHAIRVRLGDEPDLLLAEGERLVEELVSSGLPVLRVFHAEAPSARTADILGGLQAAQVECLPASGAVMKAISDTVHPQGIIAIAQRPAALTMEALRASGPSLVVMLEAVQDPGNVGTIIRTAEAAGATALVSLPGTADVYSPKVLRSAMGSAFRLPILNHVTTEELFSWAQQRGVTIAGAAGTGAVDYTDYDWRKPTLLILGNEAKGVSPALLDRCDARVRIPIRPPVESLNVASAAAVLLFEAARQRGY